jgi:hypothetical protein
VYEEKNLRALPLHAQYWRVAAAWVRSVAFILLFPGSRA